MRCYDFDVGKGGTSVSVAYCVVKFSGSIPCGAMGNGDYVERGTRRRMGDATCSEFFFTFWIVLFDLIIPVFFFPRISKKKYVYVFHPFFDILASPNFFCRLMKLSFGSFGVYFIFKIGRFLEFTFLLFGAKWQRQQVFCWSLSLDHAVSRDILYLLEL